MLITTMNDVPGHEITDVYGEVFGLTVRSRNIGSQIGAGLKSIFGGELKGMTKALADSRTEVIQRMTEEAE
ncbi:MAG: YbjQ family protein, partial [Gaiellaceae bacterium]